MLDKIKVLFKEGLEYTHTAGLLQQIANLLNIVHVQYMKDGDGKNAAIDAICELLQSHKDVPAPAAPVVPAAPQEGQNAAS
jgi:hypothetical protein